MENFMEQLMTQNTDAVVATLKKEEVKREIQSLLEQINFFTEWREVTQYSIVENFKKKGRDSYELYNLKIETENGFIMFSDANDILLEKGLNSVLWVIPEECVLDVKQEWKEGSDEWNATITFADGSIEIIAKVSNTDRYYM